MKNVQHETFILIHPALHVSYCSILYTLYMRLREIRINNYSLVLFRNEKWKKRGRKKKTSCNDVFAQLRYRGHNYLSFLERARKKKKWQRIKCVHKKYESNEMASIRRGFCTSFNSRRAHFVHFLYLPDLGQVTNNGRPT